jgi:hypothetical protein
MPADSNFFWTELFETALMLWLSETIVLLPGTSARKNNMDLLNQLGRLISFYVFISVGEKYVPNQFDGNL